MKVIGRHSLPKALLRCFLRPCLAAIPSRIFLIGFRYAQPILISYTIQHVSNTTQLSTREADSFMIILAAIFIYLGLAVSHRALPRGCSWLMIA